MSSHHILLWTNNTGHLSQCLHATLSYTLTTQAISLCFHTTLSYTTNTHNRPSMSSHHCYKHTTQAISLCVFILHLLTNTPKQAISLRVFKNWPARCPWRSGFCCWCGSWWRWPNGGRSWACSERPGPGLVASQLSGFPPRCLSVIENHNRTGFK